MRNLIVLSGLMAVTLLSAGPSFATTPEEAKLTALSAERGSQGARVLLGVIYPEGSGGFPRDDRQAACLVRAGEAIATKRSLS